MSVEVTKQIPDVQSSLDKRAIAINKVGVKDIKWPIKLEINGQIFNSVMNISMYVDLPGDKKGTHMSRFLEVLQAQNQAFSLNSLGAFLDTIQKRLEARNAFIELSFPLFIEKPAPVSGIKGIMDYQFVFRGQVGTIKEYEYGVEVPVTSVCPCSKEISRYGAHNQRSIVKLNVKSHEEINPIELIQLVERNASCDLFPILKRVDEKFVTEKGYENPKFVEDMVRDIASDLNDLELVNWYKVSSENFESIHNHSAYAEIEITKIETH